MKWLENLLADFYVKLWHAPQSLEDLYAWVAFFSFLGSIWIAANWIYRRAPVVAIALLFAWRIPRASRILSRDAQISEEAAYLALGGPLVAHEFVLHSIGAAISRYTASIITMLLAFIVVATSLHPEVAKFGKQTMLGYGFMTFVFACFVFFSATSFSIRRWHALNLAAKLKKPRHQRTDSGTSRT